MTIVHLPTTPPDITGDLGRAWRTDLRAILDKARAKYGKAPPLELNVAGWIAYAPYSHPLWPCVTVGCISLHDVPGWPPAVIHLPGATHEVFVAAIDPSCALRIDEQPPTLRPLNFAGQFICGSHDEARERIEQAVRDICDGTLNPDSDNRRAWAERFSRSNFKAGADLPDVIVPAPDGGAVVVGMGATNVRALQQVVGDGDDDGKRH